MEKLTLLLKKAWHKALVICRVIPTKKPLIKRIWYDEKIGEIFIHTNCRSGLFYLPIKKGEQYTYWVVDMKQIEGLPKNETIYRLMEIKNEPLTQRGL